MVVINLQYDLAKKILEKRSSFSAEEFIGRVYSLTNGDNRLRPISRGELPPAKYAEVISSQQLTAFSLLSLILRKGPSSIPFGKRKKEEEEKEENEKEEREAKDAKKPSPAPPFPPTGRPIPKEEKIAPPEGTELIPRLTPKEEEELRESIIDYYTVLGVSRNATRNEIRSAYRDLMKRYHPDKHPGASEEELRKLTELVQKIEFAYDTLGDDQNRADYDKTWKQYGTEKASGPAPSKDESGGILVTFQPTQAPTPKGRIEKNANSFRELVEQAGTVEMDPVARVKLGRYLPIGFDNKQLTSATKLYVKGVDSVKLEKEIDKTVAALPRLPQKAIQSLYGVSYLVAALEEGGPKHNKALQSMLLPKVSVQVSPRITPNRNQIYFSKDNRGVFKPLTSAVKIGTQIIRKKANKAIGKALEIGVKKLAKEGVKKGAGIAVKAGVTAATQAAGTAVPIIGNIAAFVVTEVIPFIAKTIKRLIPKKLKEWFQNNKKGVAAGSLGLIGAGLLFANPFFILGGLGIAAVAGSLGGFGALAGVFFTGVIGPLFVNLAGIFLATLAGMIFLTALIYFIISSSAYVVPHNPNAINPVTGVSPYINITKLADEQSYIEYDNNDIPLTVTYTITISAQQASLSNITFQSNCNVLQDNPPYPDCPVVENITVNYGPDPTGFPPTPPNIISPSLGYQITYEQTFDSSYEDSLIVDTFTISADSTSGIRSSSVGSASVAIGDPPSDCPSGWPVRGSARSYHISQGPWGIYSHRGQQAIDIAPNHTPSASDLLYATHNGSIRISGDGFSGRWVRISGNCSPHGAFSSLHGHLDFFMVSQGDPIRAGEPVGIMGHSGDVYPRGIEGTHDHYEFQGNANILMQTPFIPINVPRGCSTYTGCGSIDIP